MKRPSLDCPYAHYTPDMKVFCNQVGYLCGNQYFKACKGWWALTENAANCPKRKVKKNARKTTGKKQTD